MHISKRLLASCIVVVTSSASCGTLTSTNSSNRPPTGVSVQADEAFPSSTVRDWATYGDALVVVQVKSERYEEQGDEILQYGEGVQNRTVALGLEGEPLWTRQNSPALPTDVAVLTAGSMYKNGNTVPYVLPGEPRLEVGKTYMMLMSFFQGEWAYVTGTPTLVVGGVLVPSELQNQAWTATAGLKTPAQVAEQIVEVGPDPLAANYSNLDPGERYARVLEATKPTQVEQPPGEVGGSQGP